MQSPVLFSSNPDCFLWYRCDVWLKQAILLIRSMSTFRSFTIHSFKLFISKFIAFITLVNCDMVKMKICKPTIDWRKTSFFHEEFYTPSFSIAKILDISQENRKMDEYFIVNTSKTLGSRRENTSTWQKRSKYKQQLAFYWRRKKRWRSSKHSLSISPPPYK